MQNAVKNRVFAIDFQIANTRCCRIEHLPAVYGSRLDNYRCRGNNRSRCNDDRCGGYNRRSRSDNDRSGSYYITHYSSSSKCRGSDSPSAVVTMMMVMMRHMMMTRSMMEARSAMMSAGTGKRKTGHCCCYNHYCQFLVHVFLLFLSLLTSELGNVTMKI